MQKCQVYDDSLRFSRAVYGLLTLIAFFIHNYWLVLAVSILMAFGTVSMKLNIPYQLHSALFKGGAKKSAGYVLKDTGELKFVSGATSLLLFVGFLILYSGKYDNIAWIYILVVSLLIFLACFVGFCIATMTYILLKKIFNKQK